MSKQLNIKKLENNVVQVEFKISNNSLNMVQLVDDCSLILFILFKKENSIEEYKLSNDEQNKKQYLQVIFCHLFSDIGVPQFFLNMDIYKKKRCR